MNLETKTRAKTAIRIIKTKDPYSFGRPFDNCFEMYDGDAVMSLIIEQARTDKSLARAIQEKCPNLGYGEYNTRLLAAIDECLNAPDLFDFLS